MLEIYKNGLVSSLQCRYSELVDKVSTKSAKGIPCSDMIFDMKVISMYLKRLREYNGLESEIVLCSKICINKPDNDQVEISIIINDTPFTYTTNKTDTEIVNYFISVINNTFENITAVTFNEELNCFYLYTTVPVTELETLEVNYTIVSENLIHNNFITLTQNCDSNITCQLLDQKNCLNYSEFCIMYNKINYILNKYNCNC